MSEIEELQIAIARIQQMEAYLEQILAFVSSPSQSKCDSKSVQEAIACLNDYYESGLWLSDYEKDEQGYFPPDLKRGVLAQDTLYNLFDEIKHISFL